MSFSENILIGDEVTRFSISTSDSDRRVRTIVTKDDDGFYHIYNEFKVDHLITYNSDVHGKMSEDAYIAWLSNALFNSLYTSASNEDKRWMMNL